MRPSVGGTSGKQASRGDSARAKTCEHSTLYNEKRGKQLTAQRKKAAFLTS